MSEKQKREIDVLIDDIKEFQGVTPQNSANREVIPDTAKTEGFDVALEKPQKEKAVKEFKKPKLSKEQKARLRQERLEAKARERQKKIDEKRFLKQSRQAAKEERLAQKAKEKAEREALKQERLEKERRIKEIKSANTKARLENDERIRQERKAAREKEKRKLKALKKGLTEEQFELLENPEYKKEAVSDYYLKEERTKGFMDTIRNLGYSYTTTQFISHSVLIVMAVVIVAYFSNINTPYLIALSIAVTALCPFILTAWFHQEYNVNRFKMISDYLSNIIPIFMQKAKIRYSLGEVLPLVEGRMKRAVSNAIEYMDNNFMDTDINEKALSIIEKAFPNSRIKMVHDVMATVEGGNSVNFQRIMNNTFSDVENWIRRINRFQADLKKRRTNLLTICGLSLGVNFIFTFIYLGNEYFEGFTDNPLYQISTTLFIFLIAIVAVIVLTKLNGDWLIEDNKDEDKYALRNAYDYIQFGRPEIKLPNIIFALLMLGIGYFSFKLLDSWMFLVVCAFFAYVVLISNSVKYSGYVKRIRKHFTIEFPVFLRDLSLRMNNLTVINSIKELCETTSYPMQQELLYLLEDNRDNPTSMEPFANFMKDYNVPDIQSSMQTLYAIQNIGEGNSEAQMESLILRNEEMLDKAEELKNADSLLGVGLIGYIPMVLLTLQMMISMILMFLRILSYIQSIGIGI